MGGAWLTWVCGGSGAGTKDNSRRGGVNLGFGAGGGGKGWKRGGAGESGRLGFGNARDGTWESFC